MSNKSPLLAVHDLKVDFRVRGGWLRAVDGLDLEIGRGQRVGLVGESGSGKSVTALAILGLLRNARVTGSIEFDRIDLLAGGQRTLRKVRGSRIGLVFQDPLSSLNPVMRVGDQIGESLRIRGATRSTAHRTTVDLLERVGIPDAASRVTDFPHQFSGGMRQRVVIAIALAAQPDLLIADEPTTALDVVVQAQVLGLLEELARERQMALLLITHDLSVVAGHADRVVVMYAGRVVEEDNVDEFFYASTMPYSWGLIGSVPRLDAEPEEMLPTIGGQPPSPGSAQRGCVFHPRCAYVQEICRREAPLAIIHPGDDHPSACHFAGQLPRPAFLPTRPEVA
jgi:oligopeptide/dipeptide ABC transporter ATP-binding protein